MTELAPGISRAARKADYLPIVRALRPWMNDEEAELRASLLLFRDRACTTKPTCCEPSWALLDVVERIGSDNAMNYRVPVDQLRELRRLCAQCVMAARDFDTLFQSRLPLEGGEG
jgi:hypothetical protein